MNAVRSATRAACCMLCVTITIVTRFLSSSISSSIFSVAIGSSAEQGSSIRITSGSTASERAMHRRCCWPPDSPAPGSDRRSETSSHSPRRAQRRLDPRVQVGLALAAAPAGTEAQPGGDVVEHRHRRERVGLLEDHADRATHRDDVHRRVVHVGLVEQHAALGVSAGDLLVHAVDAAHHRRLAAARRADDRGDLVGAELQVDPLDLFGLAVEGAQALQAHAQARPGLDQAGDGRSDPVRLGHRRRRLRRRDALALALGSALWVHVSDAGGDSVGCHARRLLRETRRAIRLSSRIITTRVSAAPQARFTTAVVGEVTSS